MSESDESNLKFRPISPYNDFPEMEENILEMWENNEIYEKTQKMREDSEKYSWLEGPPTANGIPHAGHALTRTLKDVMLRYQTMKGKYVVPRIGGWDCHGLPVELEIEKELGLNSKQEIEDYGIKDFNEKCRESVLRYTNEWVQMSKRIGFWLDMENAYVTMTDDYIESVWWSLKQQYDKGLIYKGTRVAPYCARCGTTLSSHELAQGYDEVTDPSIFIKFDAVNEDFKYLAWTTTPWTLISNVMLTVNEDLEYVVVEYEGEKLLLAEGMVEKVFNIDEEDDKPEVLQRFKGKELEGKEYEPIFPFFKDLKDQGYAFKVTLADYVTLESGTGVVHSAPAFGADDAETGNKYGAPVVNPVDRDGKFDENVPPLEGMWVKDADKKIMKMLKEENKLFKRENYVHSYPHCWRCDTPLLYYGTESWFIRMSELRENLVANNDQVLWQPDYLKEGRFGNFIEKAVDWNLSRSRYWGTPLPVWRCDDCGTISFVGSKKELEEYSGGLPDDFELHRPWVDEVKWDCECGGAFERESYVIDTWYDSGSAPFAQYHYPFENKDKFETEHPYDFITEAIDQTRGWFYSLLAVSTAVFDKPAYTSVLCMNHVLAEDGSKMSKSKGNAISPDEMFDSVGADATRWYLCASPAWNTFRFGPKLVKESQRRVFNTLWNVYSFFVTNANVDEFEPDNRSDVSDRPDIDKWLISRLQQVVKEVDKSFRELSFHDATKSLDYFVVEELSNWHVRRSRRRFYGSDMTDDKQAAYDTLYETLTTLARLLAPLTPYLAEELYQNLERRIGTSEFESIHMELFPEANDDLIDEPLEKRMALALSITNAARTARAESGIKARQPLPELAVNLNENGVELPDELIEVIKEEINVKEVKFIEDDQEYVDYQVQPMLKVLAPRVKGAITSIKDHLENLSRKESKRVVQTVQRKGIIEMEIDDKEWEFTEEEILVHAEGAPGYAMGENQGVEVFLNTTVTDGLKKEGLARGLVRHIQEARKQADFDYMDRINVWLAFDSDHLSETLDQFKDYITSEVQAEEIHTNEHEDATEEEIDGHKVNIYVEKIIN